MSMESLEGFQSKVATLESSEKPKVGQIINCFGTTDDFPLEDKMRLDALDATPVDYYSNAKSWQKLHQKNAGKESYVISSADSTNKKSDRFADCTGIIAVGLEKGARKNISILTHQDYKRIVKPAKKLEKFVTDLKSSLIELRDRSESGSLDVVIFGGW